MSRSGENLTSYSIVNDVLVVDEWQAAADLGVE